MKFYDELVKIVQDHLYSKPKFIAERYKFSKRDQHKQESAAQYITVLKNLSTYCEFGTNLIDYLRDRLTSSIRSESTKQKLLAATYLTFSEAVKLITSIELTERNAVSLTHSGASSGKL